MEKRNERVIQKKIIFLQENSLSLKKTKVKLSKVDKEIKELPKKKLKKRGRIVNTTGINITKNIKLEEECLDDNTYMKISYKDKYFKLNSRIYVNQNKLTYKCIFFNLKSKDNIKNKFCDSTITALREIKDINKCLYYLKSNHSFECNEKYKNLENIASKYDHDNEFSKSKKTNLNNNLYDDNNIKKNNIIELDNDKNISNNNGIKKIYKELSNNIEIFNNKNLVNSNLIRTRQDNNLNINNLDKFDIYLKSYFINNKGITQTNFIKFAKQKYIDNGFKKKFKMAPFHLKYIYQKFSKNLLPNNMSEIYEYANSFNELGVVCQSYEVKNILNDKKEIIEHKHMIFFTEYDIKRIFSSEHILIDATYIFPVGFSETIIIMYYDIIIFKFMPAIYILINNRTKVGYTHIFKDLYEYIKNYEKEIKYKLNWKSWTSDFELVLINSFNEVFEEYKIEHHGCFIHFMKNCYKKLRSKGYASADKKEELKLLLKFTISLPFKRNINKIYKK